MADDGELKGRQGEKPDNPTEQKTVSSVTNNNQSSTMNKTPTLQDMYWFAHAAEPPVEKAQQCTKNSPTERSKHGEPLSENTIQRTEVENTRNTELEQQSERNNENSRLSGYKTLDVRRAASPVHIDGKEGSPPLSQKEREDRIRQFREQQEEERVKRLQELQVSFLQAKKYREQQEEERRRKIEDARHRELERRLAVEERKRQIWEAEQERKEAILRRNLEREARIEARRNAQRNTMSFAFGSSTPRTFDLDLAALGANRSVPQGSFLFPATTGRRSEERELPSGTKRATSACSLDRKTDDSMSHSMVSLSSVSRGRKKTDLVPAVPRDRSATPHTFSRGNQSMRAVSMTRLDQLAQPFRRYLEPSRDSNIGSAPTKSPCTTAPSMSKSMCNLPNSTLSTRPNSKLTGKEVSNSPSRPRSSMSGTSEQSATSSQTSGASLRPRVTPRRPRPVSIAGTLPEKSQVVKNAIEVMPTTLSSTPTTARNQQRQGRPLERKTPSKEVTKAPRAKSAGPEPPPRPPPKSAAVRKAAAKAKSPQPEPSDVPVTSGDVRIETVPPVEQRKSPSPVRTPTPDAKVDSVSSETPSSEPDTEPKSSDDSTTPVPLSGKSRITSEEEAKAALAEKRRLAREQAEREAELERQRQEELRRQEEERKRQEEEEQRRQEEEQLKLAELHRQMEEEKLKKAIEEQQQKEEEERIKREEEARLKAEKEEQDKKAREEAEKQRIELEEKLRKEEAERAERKKRVEQIMSRTRGKSTGQNLSNASPSAAQGDSKSSSPTEEVKPLPDNSHSPDWALQHIEAQVEGDSEGFDMGEEMNHLKGANEQEPPISVQSNNANPVPYNLFADICQPVTILSSGDDATNKPEKIIPSKDALSLGVLEGGAITKNGLPEGEQLNLIKTSSSNGVKQQSRTNSEQLFGDSVQTNGYSSHEEEMSYTEGTSPEEKSDKSEISGGLIDFNCEQPFPSHTPSEQTEFEQLIDLGAAPPVISESVDNILNNADDVNSNKLPGTPFIAFEDNVSKIQETSSLTDLLS